MRPPPLSRAGIRLPGSGDNMAAERPQGGLELEFTWRRLSGIHTIKGCSLLLFLISF